MSLDVGGRSTIVAALAGCAVVGVEGDPGDLGDKVFAYRAWRPPEQGRSSSPGSTPSRTSLAAKRMIRHSLSKRLLAANRQHRHSKLTLC